MKFLDIFFSSVVTCIANLPLIMLLLMIQQAPAVPPNPPLDTARTDEVRQLLADHDPRRLLASDYQEIRLGEDDLNDLITYIRNGNPVLATINTHADLIDDGVAVAMSIPFRAPGLVRYLNLTLHFDHVDDRLSLVRVDAGALSLPPALVTPLRRAIGGRLSRDDNIRMLTAFTDALHFRSVSDQQMVILLDWGRDGLTLPQDQAGQPAISAREAERLGLYHRRLVTTLDAVPTGVRTIGLNDLLRPMFLYASLNSAAGASPAAENRAVFIVLSAYLTDLDPGRLIGAGETPATPRTMRVVIGAREDLAADLVTSAAIAASGSDPMADLLSVYKQVHDARYRAEFGFTRAAADQAGLLLGTLATRSEADARQFQDLMKNSATETGYLPPPGTYETMTEAEFADRYGNRDSAAYRERLAEITDDIIALPFYRAFAR